MTTRAAVLRSGDGPFAIEELELGDSRADGVLVSHEAGVLLPEFASASGEVIESVLDFG